MSESITDNPFASPHAPQKPRQDLPAFIEAPTPIDVRGYCYACGAAGEEEHQQAFYRGRLLVDYTLCRNCLWRLPWQRASILVNGSLAIMALIVGGYAVTLMVVTQANLGPFSQAFLVGLASVGALIGVATGGLVVANIVLRRLAVFHWYPTELGRGFYRLTALNPQFRASYFQDEKDP